MSRAFHKFMVAVDVGTNRKLRRLPVAQRWVYVAGVLALAAQSPIRGALLIADGEPATDADVAMQATVPVKDARAALVALRRLGMLDRDADGVEWVHDWDTMNPDPRPSDSPEATRERKRRERAKARSASRGHANVTRDITVTSREGHDPEGKGEGNNNPQTPGGGGDGPPIPVRPRGNRTRDRDGYTDKIADYAIARFPDLPDPDRRQLVTAALGEGRSTHDAVAQYVRRWAGAEAAS